MFHIHGVQVDGYVATSNFLRVVERNQKEIRPESCGGSGESGFVGECGQKQPRVVHNHGGVGRRGINLCIHVLTSTW